MKKNLLLVLLFTIGLLFAQNSAPSSHIYSQDYESGDILIRTVRSTITTPATYYCTMQWNAGTDGGAYCGFQDSPEKGKLWIYSIWDPSNRQPIKAVYTGNGTIVEKFGGEGTGLKSYNNSIGWNLNEWNTVVTRRWDVGNHTYFGFWIRRDSKNSWYHMVTMDYPIANVTFNSNTNSFLEDWLSTGSETRRFEIKNVFKRKLDKTWLSGNQAYYTRNNERRSSKYTNAVNAGVNNGVFFMQSGGNTSPSFLGNLPIILKTNTNPVPNEPIISFNLTSENSSMISWKVSESTTPQFKYTIKVNGHTQISETEPEKRQANINAKIGDKVELILEDILGRTNSQSVVIKNETTHLIDGIYTIYVENSNRLITAIGNNNGDPINTIANNGSKYQQWHVTSVGNGAYKITNVANGKIIDAFGTQNNSKIGLYDFHEGANQKWIITSLNNNSYKVINSYSSKSIDEYGTNLILYDYHGGANQKFKFKLLSDSTRKADSNILQPEIKLVKIYPNPATNILNVEIYNPQETSQNIEIYSTRGTYMHGKSINTKSAKVEFNVAKFPKGEYFIKVGESTSKVMIK